MTQTVELDTAESSREERRAASVAISNITHSVANSRRMIILVGAGISTSAGIPDFRSSKGLYSGGTSSGKDLFSAEVFSTPAKSAQHLRMIAQLKSQVDSISSSHPVASTSTSTTPTMTRMDGKKAATTTHGWFGELKKRGKLARIYTQNIDGFESRVEGLKLVKLEGGLGDSTSASGSGGMANGGKGKGRATEFEGDVVQLHGSIHAVRCSLCAWVGDYVDEVHGVAFAKGKTLNCPACVDFAVARRLSGKRSIPIKSYLRPSLVLYNENSPASETISRLVSSDLHSSLSVPTTPVFPLPSPGQPDLILVMGTSLKIPGFKNLVREFAAVVHGKRMVAPRNRGVEWRDSRVVLVNMERVGKEWEGVFDYIILGSTDDFVDRVTKEWKKTRPQDWQTQTELSLDRIYKSSASTGKKVESTPRQPLLSVINSPPAPKRISTPASSQPSPLKRKFVLDFADGEPGSRKRSG